MIAADTLHGAGLGLRRSLLEPLRECASLPDFLEVAPENWIGVGGAVGRRLRAFSERTPLVCHGLALNLGGQAPLDRDYVARVGTFLALHQVSCYSEHLSYCADDGHLYDLLPLPFTAEAARHTAARIGQVQDQLGRRIAVENISYYAAPGREMSELDFIRAVVEDADCDLLLDVNNVYVNSVNHGYDARDFIDVLPTARIAYLHVAGHHVEDDGLIVDTHGAAVIDPVWQLLQHTYRRHGVLPTLLERDFNLPPLAGLLAELAQITALQREEERHVRRYA
ncbi:MAG: hypothetical protein CVV05_19290 [Gammaproteobacteria bacterium HGW-Gammaproteobacteria-1]|jgi:hypothetical protein|nr:MAG: hypothetical protein CVV05_19290 [Gammaproteobacteria bacterium HGW-Gammaproteobacteria-1]